MTTNEERIYLEELLFESALWRGVDQDSPYSPIELEIRDRLRRLSSADEVQVQAAPEPEIDVSSLGTIEASRLNEHFEQKKKQKQYTEAKKSWNRSRVRVFIDGKPVWKPLDQCIQVPRDNSRGGLPWTWKWLEPTTTTDEKKDQVEQMWAEHDRG